MDFANATIHNNVGSDKTSEQSDFIAQDSKLLEIFKGTTGSIVRARWEIIRVLMGARRYQKWQEMFRGDQNDIGGTEYQAYFNEYEDTFSRATAVEESISNFQIRQVMNYEKGDFGFGNALLLPHQLEYNMHHLIYIDKSGVMRDLVISNESAENDIVQQDVVSVIGAQKDQLDNNLPVDNADIVGFNKQLTKIVLYQRAWLKNLKADVASNG